MLVLPCFVLALSAPVLAVPSEDAMSLLGVLGGSSDIFSASLAPDRTHATLSTLKPFTQSSASLSGKSTLSPSQSPTEQSTPTPRTDSAEPTAVKTNLASAPSVLPASAESHATDHSSKTWQAIGIAIIAVLFIATSITCAMFFDRLWRFLKDVICCASRPPVSEQFIPDCEKQSWDTRTLSPSPSDSIYYKVESLREEAAVYTARARELPWNTDNQDWNTLHRQPSRRNDHPPAA